MEKLRSVFGFIFSSYRRTFAILFIGALTLAVPITLSLINQQQDIRQRASQVCANVAADLMLVIDKSTSMNVPTSSSDSTTLIQKAKTAAKSFVDVIAANNENRVGLVSFSSIQSTNLDSNLTNDFASVKTKIDAITTTGNTCTQCGIRRANEQITLNKRAGFKNAVILLTDGRANITIGSSSTDNTTAENAAISEALIGKNTNGTVYFTIGLGSSVNSQFLQQIANETGGQYFYAPTANDLQSIYNQISQIVGKGSVTGFVFNDTNSNGALDTGESKLAGWQVELKSTGQTSGTLVTSDSSGGYSYAGICDGEYVLNLKPQTSWAITSPTNGIHNLIITNGNSESNKNFGVTNTTPTVTNTPTPTATPTTVPSQTTLNITLKMTGIGNASASSGLNSTPRRPQRATGIVVINAQNQIVASKSGTTTYDSSDGLYKGSISLGNGFATGAYLVKATLDNTLWKQVPGIQNIVSGTTHQATTAQMVSGDINQDNQINLLDYNLMISCLYNSTCNTSFNQGNPQVTPTPLPFAKYIFDFNDDDKIDELDLNILYVGFAKRTGD